MLILETEGGRSEFALRPIGRENAGTACKRIAVDTKGRPCRRALLTQDGLLLPKGATAEGYEDGVGNSAPRGEVVAVDDAGVMLRELPSTSNRPQRPVGPVSIEELLEHVTLKAYVLKPRSLAPDLARFLARGEIFRVEWRPRKSVHNQPAFLLGNDTGYFLLRCEAISAEWVQRENPVQWDDVAEDDILLEAGA